jgi:hypothetical protein
LLFSKVASVRPIFYKTGMVKRFSKVAPRHGKELAVRRSMRAEVPAVVRRALGDRIVDINRLAGANSAPSGDSGTVGDRVAETGNRRATYPANALRNP